MSDNTKIEWTDATWNPITGCTKVSLGCRNCYAMKFAERWRGTPGHYFEKGFNVTLRPDKLDQPLRWRKPRRIFVNSMSDLFHPDVPFDYVDQVFAIMVLCPRHTFQVLTKRPERMVEYFRLFNRKEKIASWIGTGGVYPAQIGNERRAREMIWPLPNVWLGVSVENQRAADERIPLLLQTPAAVRFLSMEPLLGPVDLAKWLPWDSFRRNMDMYEPNPNYRGIDWVIVGGESGPGARPMHPDWVRSLRDQCQAAGVPLFMKQWGEWAPTDKVLGKKRTVYAVEGGQIYREKPLGLRYTMLGRVGKKAAGRLLDGRTWDEFPEVLL